MHIVTVMQARMSSTRLPGKILKPILGEPLLLRFLERVKASPLSGTLVVATSTEPDDDGVEVLCTSAGLNVFRGSLSDLLSRHYHAGKAFHADAVVKIPSDCPLIDPEIITRVLQFYIDHSDQYDFVSNLHPATYPDGNDVEIMSMSALERAYFEAKKDFEREHTTPYFWDTQGLFRTANITWEIGLNYSMSHRWTIDYEEDYQFIKRVYEELYPLRPHFGLHDILDLLNTKPEIAEINEKYAGVNWYRNHLDVLRTIDQSQTKIL